MLVLAACAASLAGCAARIPPRPSGTPAPDATAIDAFTTATTACAGIRTLTGELRLSGRAGTERIRGTLLAGLAAPASVRFEAVAPFGQPFFLLAGRDNRATLVLPRDGRVLADAAVPDVLERLTGLNLSASDLRLILTGCLTDDRQPTDGRRWPNGWQSVSLRPATAAVRLTAYLRPVNGAPALVAADHGAWRVDYANHLNGFPRSVRLRSADSGEVDLTAAIAQLAINAGIDDRAFELTPPATAQPMTLDELRSVAPLRAR